MAWRSFERIAAIVVLLGCDAREPMVERAGEVPEREPDPPVDPKTPADPEPEPEPECTLVEPPAGFVDLRTTIPSAIIVAGYHRTDNFTGARLPGYEAPGAWLSTPAAEALARAAERLEADDLRLIIYDAYRPRQASEAMVEWCNTHGRTDLLEDGWVAARSTHSRGLSIDVGLADAQGRALDMGSGWDQFDRHSHVHGVDGPALSRRLRLRQELMRVGYEPYAREWWHFTFATDLSLPARAEPYGCEPAN